MIPSPTRRSLIAGVAGAAALPGFLSTARATDRKPALCLAHITDTHITSERDAPKGMAMMFAHMFGQKDWKPDVVLNTGDTVMAVNGKVPGKRAEEQIAVWKQAVKACPVPIKSCLGNHDVWGGVEPVDEAQAKKKGFGLMVEALGMPAPYYSFDQGEWHFIVLNSVCEWPKYGTLSREHFDWLKDDLAKTPKTTPVLVMSHLPILSVTSFAYGDDCLKGSDNVIPGNWQHSDCWAITEVFRRHPNVKLCLSGHMHTCDRCEYRGVWYICGGSAGGARWIGSHYGFHACYGAVELFADGGFTYRFMDYGWKEREWKGKQLPA